MLRKSTVSVIWLLVFVSAYAQTRPMHTFSIVARDPVNGDLGVAVQSHWFSVGPIVPWAEAGVGAVATQSFVDPFYGLLGLELMRGGKTAKQALEGLLVTVHRAYDHMNAGDLAVERKDLAGALREYNAAESLNPENLEMKYWHAISLVNSGHLDESLPLFKSVFEADRNWVELTPRLTRIDLLKVNEGELKKILSLVNSAK